jgi:hypothetical protein
METAAAPGVEQEVEVWCESTRRWVRGFRLVRAQDGTARLRRGSDGMLLPATFSDQMIRPVAARTWSTR